MEQKFTAKLWIYPGDAAWHFVTVPKKISSEIKEKRGKNARGFGSLPVKVTVGKSVWNTSVFPDRKSDTYLLPMKKKVRTAEGIFDGDTVTVSLTV